MRLVVSTNQSVITVMRRAGYGLLGQDQTTGEFSFAKRASGGDYPRFHAYVKKDGGQIIINIHLDQKKPSYGGSRAHNGEYEGPLLDLESQKIKTAIQSLK
jgi:hypothetical protein